MTFTIQWGKGASKPILSSTDLAALDINPFDLKLPQLSPDELMGENLLTPT
jgi:hypothetical protein